MTAGTVAVEQVDRDEAMRTGDEAFRNVDVTACGDIDWHALFAGFARHRLAAASAQPGVVALRDEAATLQYELAQPHEWGYRDVADGTFITDDAPFRASAMLGGLAASMSAALSPNAITDDGARGSWNLDRVIAEAREMLRLVDGCLECNADDVRRWRETIDWLEQLA